MAIAQPDFNKIFASAAALGEIQDWPIESFLRGWGYLKNSEPPPMEFFNALQKSSDTKDQYLFKTANIRENKVQYRVGDVVTTPNLPSMFLLVCTVEGTTGENEPALTDVEKGDTLTDGTCKWQVKSKLGVDVAIQKSQPTNQASGDIWLEVD